MTPALTRDQILATAETEGETKIRHFCEALQQGSTPDPKDTRYVLRILKKHKEPGKPGRKNTYDAAWPPIWTAILVAERIDAGMTKAKAIETAAFLTRKTPRAARRNYDEHKSVAWGWARILARRRPRE